MNNAAETCRKIDNFCLMMSLHNLEEKHVTQIQAVHSKNKEIQIALSTMFRIAYYPFRGCEGCT